MATLTPIIRSRAITRHTVLPDDGMPSIRKAMHDIRRRENVSGDFSTIDTPLTAQSKTLFKIYADPRRVLFAICLLDGPAASPAAGESLELFFDPRQDGIGYWQYVFDPGHPDDRLTRHHLPYPECRSTAYPMLEPSRVARRFPDTDASPRGLRPNGTGRRPIPERWLFVWFDRASLFREADPIGFNIGRIDDHGEKSSWNHSSGHGLQAPSSFGRLHARAPQGRLTLHTVACGRRDLRAQGAFESARKRPTLRWIDPLGREKSMTVAWNGTDWTATVRGAAVTAGRHHLLASLPNGKIIAPDTFPVDLIDPTPADRASTVGVTYDFNVNLRRAPAYTTEALDAEFQLYADHGVGRLYWIDFNFFPAFRKHSPLGVQGEKQCGPFLPLAAKLAKRRGLDFYGIFKPFDLPVNAKGTGPAALPPPVPAPRAGKQATVAERQAYALACNHDLAVQRDPAIPRPPDGPIRRIAFFSLTRLPPVKRDTVRIWISDDNVSYRSYPGTFSVRQDRVRRPHRAWTAADNQPDSGSALNWRLVLDDLRIDAPYAAVTFTGSALRIRHRAHAIVEAYDDRGEIAVIPALSGSHDQGFDFWTEWPSWANRSPRMLETLQWGATADAALTFRIPERLPSFYEPACEATHDLWLYAVDRLCTTEADGLSIRTLCHHKAAFDLLMYAYGPEVRTRFRREYGREPRYDAADAERIRRIRGRAYSDFVQKASQRVRAAGKRFSMHFEAGIEVPPSLDQRLQFDLEWERWIQEGWLDEIVLKWWFAQDPFIHQHVLPKARRAGIKVWLTGRNSSLRRTPRRIEQANAMADEARAAGFDGVTFYEAADWMERNIENVPEFHHQIGAALMAAAGRTVP